MENKKFKIYLIKEFCKKLVYIIFKLLAFMKPVGVFYNKMIRHKTSLTHSDEKRIKYAQLIVKFKNKIA